jgi:acetolactate synthase-1/2/3 large subunit
LGFEYVAANPGSSFRGLHESLINYGGNKNPELLTCCHEESSVAMAHGYAEVANKPMLALAHGTVGVQHASMAIYNAYAGRAPVFIILGNVLGGRDRRPGGEWSHSVQDAAAMVRDYTKWDDCPRTLADFAESAARAYTISMTLPRMPVVLVADYALQEYPAAAYPKFEVVKATPERPPVADSGAVAELARLLVSAENPVIIAGRVARTEDGVTRLRQFAETLQAPVIDSGANLPSRHPLNQGNQRMGLLQHADVVLGLEADDLYGTLYEVDDQEWRPNRRLIPPTAKIISIRTGGLFLKSNYQDFQRYMPFDMEMAADPDSTLPALTEAVKKVMNDDRKRAFQDRGAKFAVAGLKALEQAHAEASVAWDASPISATRLQSELWNAVKDEDWAVMGDMMWGRGNYLWNFTKYYQRWHGGSAIGIGFAAPAAVGAALAHRKEGRVCVHINNDGDMLYAPGVLWTAAHHKIPLLMVMNNNRAYHMEMMHVQRMCARRQRGITNGRIGTEIVNPPVDFSKIAQGFGVYAEGPISDPKELGPAFKRALAVVKRGEPALIDAYMQPR